jgi:hypothetical protein
MAFYEVARCNNIKKINLIFKNNNCLLNRNQENTQKAKKLFIWNINGLEYELPLNLHEVQPFNFLIVTYSIIAL